MLSEHACLLGTQEYSTRRLCYILSCCSFLPSYYILPAFTHHNGTEPCLKLHLNFFPTVFGFPNIFFQKLLFYLPFFQTKSRNHLWIENQMWLKKMNFFAQCAHTTQCSASTSSDPFHLCKSLVCTLNDSRCITKIWQKSRKRGLASLQFLDHNLLVSMCA